MIRVIEADKHDRPRLVMSHQAKLCRQVSFDLGNLLHTAAAGHGTTGSPGKGLQRGQNGRGAFAVGKNDLGDPGAGTPARVEPEVSRTAGRWVAVRHLIVELASQSVERPNPSRRRRNRRSLIGRRSLGSLVALAHRVSSTAAASWIA
jgi:hypothetical protein